MRQSLSCLENTEAEEFMEKWVVSAKKADFQQIANKFGIDPVVARLIRNREQITDEEIDTYLHGKITELHSWKLLKGMESLLDILTEKIKEQKKIRIIGDYDIDGVCSTYILLKGLKRAGAAVDVDIPDRMKDGYGISRELIDLAKEAGTGRGKTGLSHRKYSLTASAPGECTSGYRVPLRSHRPTVKY